MEQSDIPCLCINVRRAANAITAFYDNAMAQTGITVPQYSLMSNLQKMGSANISALADKVHLERSTLLRNLKPLKAAGYIVDNAKKGARDACLSLTTKGIDIVITASPFWEKAQNEVRATIGEKDIVNSFLDSLYRVQRLK